MKTFLFVWSPKKAPWPKLAQDIAQLRRTAIVSANWTVASHKKVQPGDRAFLLRLGVEPKGIMGSGYVTTAPFLAPHWRDPLKMTHRVTLEFDTLLDPERELLLGIDLLRMGSLSAVNWTPQSSGIEIYPQAAEELEAVWLDFLQTERSSGLLP